MVFIIVGFCIGIGFYLSWESEHDFSYAILGVAVATFILLMKIYQMLKK